MVGFTKHVYNFPGSKADVWFSLVLKFHRGVESRVLTSTGQLYRGYITKEFLDAIPRDTSAIYTIKTKRCWASHSAMLAMPTYAMASAEERQLVAFTKGETVVRLARIIDSTVMRRLGERPRDITLRLRRTFPEGTTFDDLMSAMRLVDCGKHVTRFYASRKNEAIHIALEDWHTMRISPSCITDAGINCFDIDDGFVDTIFGNDLRQTKWHQDAVRWRERFNKTGGASWDEPVLISDC